MGSSVFYRGIRLGANLWLPGMMHIGVFRHFVSCILSQCPMAPISLCVVVNLIQETLCGNFMDLCTFHVNNAELCK